MLYRPTTRWTWIFFSSLFLEALIAISLETACLIQYKTNLIVLAGEVPPSSVIPSFLSFIILGFLYQLVFAYDTLAQQNTIQLYGLCAYSIVICVFCGLQYSQVMKEVFTRSFFGVLHDTNLDVYKGILITMIVMSALSCCWLLFVAWKLHEEFAWVVFKKVDADLGIRRRYWTFQTLLSILKFDVFFFLGFLVHVVVVWTIPRDHLWIMAVFLIPFSCLLLAGTASSVRHENKPWTLVFLVLFIALTALFIWGYRALLYMGKYASPLQTSHIVALFGSLSILLSSATTIMIYMCLRNFDKGLKPYVCGGREARIMGETFESSCQEYSLVSQA